MHPVICVIMETEIWPNLLAVCQRNNVPVCLVNARLSENLRVVINLLHH